MMQAAQTAACKDRVLSKIVLQTSSSTASVTLLAQELRNLLAVMNQLNQTMFLQAPSIETTNQELEVLLTKK